MKCFNCFRVSAQRDVPEIRPREHKRSSVFSKFFYGRGEELRRSEASGQQSRIGLPLEDSVHQASPPFYKKKAPHLETIQMETFTTSIQNSEGISEIDQSPATPQRLSSIAMIRLFFDPLKRDGDFASACIQFWKQMEEKHESLTEEFQQFCTYYETQIQKMQEAAWKDRIHNLQARLREAKRENNHTAVKELEHEIKALERFRKKIIKDFYNLLRKVTKTLDLPHYAHKDFGRRGVQSDIDINICTVHGPEPGLEAIDDLDFSLIAYQKILASSLFSYLTKTCSKTSVDAEFYIEHIGNYIDLSQLDDAEAKKYYTQIVLSIHFITVLEHLKAQEGSYQVYVKNFKEHFFPRLKSSLPKEDFERFLNIVIDEAENFHRLLAEKERQYDSIEHPCNRESTFRISMILYLVEKAEAIDQKIQSKEHRIDLQNLRMQKVFVWTFLTFLSDDGYFLPGTFRSICLLKGGQMNKEADIKNQAFFRKGENIHKKLSEEATASDYVESAIENGVHYLKKLQAARDFEDFLKATKFGKRFNDGAVGFYQQLAEHSFSSPKHNRSSNDLLRKKSGGFHLQKAKMHSFSDRTSSFVKKISFNYSGRIFRRRSLPKRKKSLLCTTILDLARRRDCLAYEEAKTLVKHYIQEEKNNHKELLAEFKRQLDQKISELKGNRQGNKLIHDVVDFSQKLFFDLLLNTYPHLEEEKNKEDLQAFLQEEFLRLKKAFKNKRLNGLENFAQLIEAFIYQKLKGQGTWQVQSEEQRYEILETLLKRHYYAAIPGDVAFEPLMSEEESRSFLSIHGYNLGFIGIFPFKDASGKKVGFNCFHEKLQGVFDALSNTISKKRADLMNSLVLNPAHFSIEEQIQEAMNVIPELFADAFNYGIFSSDYRYYQDFSPLYLISDIKAKFSKISPLSVSRARKKLPQFVHSFTARSVKRSLPAKIRAEKSCPELDQMQSFHSDASDEGWKSLKKRAPTSLRLGAFRLIKKRPEALQAAASSTYQVLPDIVPEEEAAPEKDLWESLQKTLEVSRALLEESGPDQLISLHGEIMYTRV